MEADYLASAAELEVFDPIDFEEFLHENCRDVAGDPLSRLIQTPNNDIVHLHIEPIHKTGEPALPSGNDNVLFKTACSRLMFKRRYAVFQRSVKPFSSQHVIKRIENILKLCSFHIKIPFLIEIGSSSSCNGSEDQTHVSLVECNSIDHNEVLSNSTPTMCYSVFNAFPSPDPQSIIEHVPSPLAPIAHCPLAILLRFQMLQVVSIEPLFFSVAIYDLGCKKKISECFHFDFTTEHQKQLLIEAMNGENVFYSSLARSCVFQMSCPSDQIVAIFRMTKVVEAADINEASLPYMSTPPPANDDKVDRRRSEAANRLRRLGHVRMPLGWAFFPLSKFLAKQNVSQEVHTNVAKFFRFDPERMTDQDLMAMTEAILSSRSPSTSHSLDRFKLKTLHCRLNFSLTNWMNAVRKEGVVVANRRTFTPDLNDVQNYDAYECAPARQLSVPYGAGSPNSDKDPTATTMEFIKEVQEFPPYPLYEPVTTHTNVLYVYPQQLQLLSTSVQGQTMSATATSSRNLIVKVELRGSVELMRGQVPEDARASVLPAVYGRHCQPDAVRHAFSTVLYHCRQPTFADEIKIALPDDLNSCYHLFFTISHVSCNTKKLQDGTNASVDVAYTWLPLLDVDGCLVCGSTTLPLVADEPPLALTRYHPKEALSMLQHHPLAAALHWIDTSKSAFTVELRPLTTTHSPSTDEAFRNFLRNAFQPPEMALDEDSHQALLDSVKALPGADLELITSFLPVVCDKLIQLILSPVDSPAANPKRSPEVQLRPHHLQLSPSARALPLTIIDPISTRSSASLMPPPLPPTVSRVSPVSDQCLRAEDGEGGERRVGDRRVKRSRSLGIRLGRRRGLSAAGTPRHSECDHQTAATGDGQKGDETVVEVTGREVFLKALLTASRKASLDDVEVANRRHFTLDAFTQAQRMHGGRAGVAEAALHALCQIGQRLSVEVRQSVDGLDRSMVLLSCVRFGLFSYEADGGVAVGGAGDRYGQGGRQPQHLYPVMMSGDGSQRRLDAPRKRRYLHEELTRLWMMQAKNSELRRLTLSSSWLLFELIVASMRAQFVGCRYGTFEREMVGGGGGQGGQGASGGGLPAAALSTTVRCHQTDTKRVAEVLANGLQPDDAGMSTRTRQPTTDHKVERAGNQSFGPTPRKVRFPPHFTEDLCTLCMGLIREVTTYVAESRSAIDGRVVVALNRHLAFFLQDLLSFLDRGYVLELVQQYFKAFQTHMQRPELSAIELDAFVSLRLDFLSIVTAHEHMVSLCLPLISELPSAAMAATPMNDDLLTAASASPVPSASGDSVSSSSHKDSSRRRRRKTASWSFALTKDFSRRHYLSSLLLAEVALALRSPCEDVQTKAVSALRNLLTSHDHDPRYAEPAGSAATSANGLDFLSPRSRLAGTIYLPIVDVLCDALPALWHFDAVWKKPQNNEGETVKRKCRLCFFIRSLTAQHSREGDGRHSGLREMATDAETLSAAAVHAVFGGDASGTTTTAVFDDVLGYSAVSGGGDVALGLSDASSGVSTSHSPFDSCAAPETLRPALSPAVSRELLACFAWFLRHVAREDLKAYVRRQPPVKCLELLHGAHLVGRAFRYDPTNLAVDATKNGVNGGTSCAAEDDATTSRSTMNGRRSSSQQPALRQSKRSFGSASDHNSESGQGSSRPTSGIRSLLNFRRPTTVDVESTSKKRSSVIDTDSSFGGKSLTNVVDANSGVMTIRRNIFEVAAKVAAPDFTWRAYDDMLTKQYDCDEMQTMLTVINGCPVGDAKRVVANRLATLTCLSAQEACIDLVKTLLVDVAFRTTSGGMFKGDPSERVSSPMGGAGLELHRNFILPAAVHALIDVCARGQCLTSDAALASTSAPGEGEARNVANVQCSSPANLPVTTVTRALALLRMTLLRWPTVLTDVLPSTAVARLLTATLQLCSSTNADVRRSAVSTLYLAAKQHFLTNMKTFPVLKHHLISALSFLVNRQRLFSFDALRKSLMVLQHICGADVNTSADVVQKKQLSRFVERMMTLLRDMDSLVADTRRLERHESDPHTQVELMWRIARNYRSSPDLRLAWLRALSEKHMALQQTDEAAMCLVHAAALIAEQLRRRRPNDHHLPAGARAFSAVSPNVALDESAVHDDVVPSSPVAMETGDDTEMVTLALSRFFSEKDLVALVDLAAQLFIMAEKKRLAYELYKLLVPIYERRREKTRLSMLYQKLRECCTVNIDATQPNKTGDVGEELLFTPDVGDSPAFANGTATELQPAKRSFSTFFRIAYHGKRFSELDGKEFVIRVPGLKQLSELAFEQQNLYEQLFLTVTTGEDGEQIGNANSAGASVEILKDSKPVKLDQLDARVNYIQLTHVEPYRDVAYDDFKDDELLNVRRFEYSTPFTDQPNRPHGEVALQFKTRTVITTARAFPYLTSRQLVVRKRETVLTPIEVCLEDIRKKSDQLTSLMRQRPIPARILQMILHGCVWTSVNRGPLEVAEVFLMPCRQGDVIPTQAHHRLRLCFKRFLDRCQRAVALNRSLIAADQRDYQTELERNLKIMEEKLLPIIADADCLTPKLRPVVV